MNELDEYKVYPENSILLRRVKRFIEYLKKKSGSIFENLHNYSHLLTLGKHFGFFDLKCSSYF
jgi:hypothetical protein